jgi:hypothetical protein
VKTRTELSGGVVVRTFRSPPEGWIVERIPLDDSPPELARNGEVYFGGARRRERPALR